MRASWQRFVGVLLGVALAALLVVPGTARVQEIACPSPCVCVCPTATLVAAPTVVPGFGTVRVAQLTDLHAGGDRNNPEAIVYMMSLINSQVDVVVITGDSVEQGWDSEWDLFGKWTALLQVPWRDLPGNHDSTFDRARNWVWRVGGYSLVGLDWVNPDLALLASASRPMVVFSHWPLADSAPEVRSAVVAARPLVYVCGHVHYWSSSYVDGILQLTMARSGLGTYRVLTLENGVVR